MALEDGWKTICLDRCWDIVTCEFNIGKHSGMKAAFFEAPSWPNLDGAFLNDIDFLDPEKIVSK